MKDSVTLNIYIAASTVYCGYNVLPRRVLGAETEKRSLFLRRGSVRIECLSPAAQLLSGVDRERGGRRAMHAVIVV